MGTLRGFGLARKLSKFTIEQIPGLHRAAQLGFV